MFIISNAWKNAKKNKTELQLALDYFLLLLLYAFRVCDFFLDLMMLR